jgi:hypothetical protein
MIPISISWTEADQDGNDVDQVENISYDEREDLYYNCYGFIVAHEDVATIIQDNMPEEDQAALDTKILDSIAAKTGIQLGGKIPPLKDPGELTKG